MDIISIRTITGGVPGLKRNVSAVPCSDYSVKAIRFLNKQGGYEYAHFYQRDALKRDRSSEQYLQFEDGFKNVNGDTQDRFDLFRDDYPAKNRQVLDDLNANQNIWYAEDWQISEFSALAQPQTPASGSVPAADRLVRIDLTDADFAEAFRRFDTGDRVSFISLADELGMYGTIAAFDDTLGASGVQIYFNVTDENDDTTTLDGWIAGGTSLHLTAWDAWQLCTFLDSTVIDSGRDALFVKIALKTNPKTNYRV